MSRCILFNADDWGLSPHIHNAITALIEKEAIDAAGLMMKQRETQRAIDYLNATRPPGLRTGIHLFANDPDCRPLSRPAWPLLWPRKLRLNLELSFPTVRKIVLNEVRKQLQAYADTGLSLDFVNSHFHFHANPAIFDDLRATIESIFPGFEAQGNTWMRLGAVRLFPLPVMPGANHFLETVIAPLTRVLQHGETHWRGGRNKTLWGLDRTFKNQADEIVQAASDLESGFHEFFFHPGRHFNLGEPAKGTDLTALNRLAGLLPRNARITA